MGSLEAGTFTVVPALDASIPTTAQLRVLHASPDAPPIDVVLNGVRVFGNLPFGQASITAETIPRRTADPGRRPGSVPVRGEPTLHRSDARGQAIGPMTIGLRRPGSRTPAEGPLDGMRRKRRIAPSP